MTEEKKRAKKGIYISSKRTFLVHDENEEKIFKFLLKAKDGANQTQIANFVNISRKAVKSRLDNMLSERFFYGGIEYSLIYKKPKYFILKKERTTVGLEPNATWAQETEFKDKFDYVVEDLSRQYISVGQIPEYITDNIILYDVKPKCWSEVKSNIKELYNDAIYDIALGDRGIYIVLEDNSDENKLNKIKESIQTLFEKSNKIRKLNSASDKKQ